VLQDKNSTDLLGMLAMGFSVGEWAREINILESHIIGDPTFRFSGEEASRIDLNTTQGDYWLSLYENEPHPDLKGLALNKLFYLEHESLPKLLIDAYQTSPYYAVRWQAFHLLQHYRGDAFADLLEQAIYDPYEFIRRKAVYSMGRMGDDRFIPGIVSVYLNDYLDERVYFNSTFTFDLVDAQKLEAEVKRQLEENRSFPDKEAVWNKFKGLIDSRGRIASMADAVTDKEKSQKARLSATRMLRNYAYHHHVPDYLEVIADPGEEESLRIALSEALGWFTLSYQRDAIAATLQEVADNPETPVKLRNELLKSLARLKVYTQ
jgi:HEAT repeat protein